MAEHATSIEINAKPAVVFEYLVTPQAMTAWMGQHAVLEPQPGGVFEVDIAGSPIRGTYLEVDPPAGSSCPGEWPAAMTCRRVPRRWSSRSPRPHRAHALTSCTRACQTLTSPDTSMGGPTSFPACWWSVRAATPATTTGCRAARPDST